MSSSASYAKQLIGKEGSKGVSPAKVVTLRVRPDVNIDETYQVCIRIGDNFNQNDTDFVRSTFYFHLGGLVESHWVIIDASLR